MDNITSYVRCHGAWECFGSYDCYSSVMAQDFELIFDGEWITDMFEWQGAYVEGDGTVENTENNPLFFHQSNINCNKDAGCALEIKKDFVYQGWALKPIFGGSGDFYYGQVTADVTVDWEALDTTPPIVDVIAIPYYLKAGSYMVEIIDTEEESNFEICRYKIEEWTKKESDDGIYIKTVKSFTERSCGNEPIGITASPTHPILNKEAHEAYYKFIATAKNNVLTAEGEDFDWIKFDFTSPGTEIR